MVPAVSIDWEIEAPEANGIFIPLGLGDLGDWDALAERSDLGEFWEGLEDKKDRNGLGLSGLFLDSEDLSLFSMLKIKIQNKNFSTKLKPTIR